MKASAQGAPFGSTGLCGTGESVAQGFGSQEREDLAGAGFGVTLISEASEDTSRFIKEGERLPVGLNPFEFSGSVVGRLIFDRFRRVVCRRRARNRRGRCRFGIRGRLGLRLH